MELTLSHTIKNNILFITPEFEKLDILNATNFKNKVLELLHQTQIPKIIFDLKHIHFMDSWIEEPSMCTAARLSRKRWTSASRAAGSPSWW